MENRAQNTSAAMSIDVIIPVYNGEKYILQAIRSVEAQTYPANRIIVVDDGSTDGTREIIMQLEQSNPRIRYIYKENGGLSSARNEGIGNVDSEFVAFLDADDEWFESKLEKQMDVFQNSKLEKLGLVYCQYVHIDEKSELITNLTIVSPRKDMRGLVFEKLLPGNLISSSGSGVLVRKECFEKVGNFDEALKAAEDWDMWLRIAREFEFDFVSEDLVKIRRHGENMQKNKEHMFLNLLTFFDKWGNTLEKKYSCPVIWADTIRSFIFEQFPKTSFYTLASKNLTTKACKRIFALTGGSLKLYLFSAALIGLPLGIVKAMKLFVVRIIGIFKA